MKKVLVIQFITIFSNVFAELIEERGKLFLGKIPNNEFFLAELNGFYTPEDAITTCEKSLQCAGFMYRGLKNSTLFRSKKYDVYFFYFIPEVRRDHIYRDYVSYYSTRTLGVFEGIIGQAMGVSVKATKENHE